MSRKINSWITTLFLVLSVLFSLAQNRALGTWKMYMPYHNAVGLSDAGNKLYVAALQSFYSFDKNTATVQTFDKATGLSDIGVKLISYDPNTKTLVVVYNTSNIDLLVNGTDVYNIPDIEQKSQTGGTAININGVSFYNGNAYLSTDQGISVLNLTTKLIGDTYVIGSSGSPVKVYSSCIDGTAIYAATAEGVKFAPLSSPNLLDFNNWTLFNGTQLLPTKAATFVAAYSNKIYAVIHGTNTDTLYQYNGINWQNIYSSSWNTIHSLDAVDGNLYFGIWYDSTGISSGYLGKIDTTGQVNIRPCQGHFRPLNWFESNGSSWESDAYNGLYINTNGTVQGIVPDGPFSSSVFRLNVKNGAVDVAPGGVDDSWGFDYNRDGFFIYQNNKWLYRNGGTDASLANFSDIICTASVNSTGKTYFGSFYAGLIEYDNQSGQINLYDKTNSLLEGTAGDIGRTKISCLVTDRYDNMWIGDAGATKPIKVIKPDGTWAQFSVPYNFGLMKTLTFDQNGQLWAPLRSNSNGLLVWSYNGTIDDPSDDVSRVLSVGQGNGGLPDPNVYSVAEDLDGNIWVGTDAGVAVFYCPGSELTSDGCDAEQIKVVGADGYVAYLFGSESVRAIAVDAANRKWVGTTNGVWLISADGQTQLLNFNTTNSPMPANQVTDIQIDNTTGEVYIGTISGLVSYRGDAIGDCNDCGKVLVYPNPVKPDYDGPIAIKGLASNAYVKITDVTGTLVYQGNANGSQMVWNGRNYNGVRAKSGVYLVFSSDDLGQDKKVAKILVMN